LEIMDFLGLKSKKTEIIIIQFNIFIFAFIKYKRNE